MRTTLLDAKDSAIGQTIGIPGCDPRFVQLLNDAQSQLSLMGLWWGTFQRRRVCILENCITWPRDVMTVLGFNVCRYGIPIRNDWWEFQENVIAPKAGCNSCSCDRNQLLPRGRVQAFKDIPTYGKIRIVSAAVDDGAEVLLQGKDPNGVPIRTLVDGSYINGEYVTLAQPYVETVFDFNYPGLTGVQKPITQQPLNVYYVDPVTGDTTLMAIWEPSEKNPDYIRNYLVNVPLLCDPDVETTACAPCVDTGDGCAIADTNCTGYMADAIVRCSFIPALVDTDWLFISNLDALESAMLSIKLRRDRDYKGALIEMEQAKQTLRNELDAYSPPERTVINIQTMGTAPLSRVMAGFI